MQVAVLGLGRFGSNLAINLAKLGAEVIAIDSDMAAVQEVADVVEAVQMDSTDEKELMRRGVVDMDVAVVAIGEDIQATILTTAILRRLGVLKIIARATSPIQAEILREVGAREVVYIEEQYAELLARNIMSEAQLSRIPVRPNYSVAEIRIPDRFVGKTLGEIDLRGKYGLMVLAVLSKKRDIGRHGKTVVETVVNDFPTPDLEIEEEDTLLVFGTNDNLNELEF